MSKELLIKNERVSYLDMLKCIGILIVVQGHIYSNYGWFSLPLHSFVIPLFFFLSGLTFRRNKFSSFRKFIFHRGKTLLVPYVIFSFVTWIIWVGYNFALGNDVDFWTPFVQTFVAQGSGGFLVHNVPLWFVPCLFVIESVYYFIDKLSVKLNFIVCGLCAALGVWMIVGPYSDVFKLLPWSSESALVALIFYCMGNILTKKYSLSEIECFIVDKNVLSLLSIIVCVPILVLSAYWNQHISLGSDLLGRSPVLFYVNAFLGIFIIYLFAVLICAINTTNKFWIAIKRYLLFAGRNSFYIMAVHVPIKGILIVAIAAYIGENTSYVVNNYSLVWLVFIITLAFSSILSVYVARQKKRDEAFWTRFRKKNA